MKILSLLAVLTLPLSAQLTQSFKQGVITTQPGLIWLEKGEKSLYAVSIAFSSLSADRLYPGKKLNLTITDSMGNVIPAKTYYEFDQGRAAVFCELAEIPQGSWLEISGTVDAGTEYTEESFFIQSTPAKAKHEGDGYSFSCSTAGLNEFILMEKGYSFPTMMSFKDAQGKEINPLYNRVLRRDASERDFAFVFADDVDVSQLRFEIERREAKAPQSVPVNLRFNVVGLPVSKDSPASAEPPVVIAAIPAEIGSMKLKNMSIAHRSGVSRGRFEASRVVLTLTPAKDAAVDIPEKQKITYSDASGFSIPATLEFVTQKEDGTINLSFDIDSAPRALPFTLSGDLKASVQGKETALPIQFTIQGFPTQED